MTALALTPDDVRARIGKVLDVDMGSCTDAELGQALVAFQRRQLEALGDDELSDVGFRVRVDMLGSDGFIAKLFAAAGELGTTPQVDRCPKCNAVAENVPGGRRCASCNWASPDSALIGGLLSMALLPRSGGGDDED